MPTGGETDMKKCTIEKVDNGWIVRVVEQGVSEFKTLYDNPVKVFTTFDSLIIYLGSYWS